VSEKPLLYLMDTPGVMLPRVNDSDAGLKLALSGAIKDEVIQRVFLFGLWLAKTYSGSG
jgi:ribosome biogenesis GTPase A